jgi:hypothetical protein
VHAIWKTPRKNSELLIFHRHKQLDYSKLQRKEDFLLASIFRVILDAMGDCSRYSMVATINDCLNRGWLRYENLVQLTEVETKFPGKKKLRQLLPYLSAKCESAFESEGWIYFHERGWMIPDQQVKVYDEQGRFVARLDFLFIIHKGKKNERKVDVEFDGAAFHYDRLREDRVRDEWLNQLGYEVLRVSKKQFDAGLLGKLLETMKIPRRRNNKRKIAEGEVKKVHFYHLPE